MIIFRNLTTKQVLAFSEQELRKENNKTVSQLRKWIGEYMLKMSKVIEVFDSEDENTKVLKEQKFKLATKRALIDKIKDEY